MKRTSLIFPCFRRATPYKDGEGEGEGEGGRGWLLQNEYKGAKREEENKCEGGKQRNKINHRGERNIV